MCLGYLSTAREGVLRVEYFKRLTTHASDDRRFKLVDELEEFLVPSSMLSGGGASLPIALAQVSRARLELSRETCDAILAKLLISSLSLRTTLVINCRLTAAAASVVEKSSLTLGAPSGCPWGSTQIVLVLILWVFRT